MNIHYILYKIKNFFNKKSALNYLFKALDCDIKKVIDIRYKEIQKIRNELDVLPETNIFKELKDKKHHIIKSLKDKIKIETDCIIAEYINEFPILIVTHHPEKIIKNKEVIEVYKNLAIEIYKNDNIMFITLSELDKLVSKIRRIVYNYNLDFDIVNKLKVLSNYKYEFFDENSFYIKYYILSD